MTSQSTVFTCRTKWIGKVESLLLLGSSGTRLEYFVLWIFLKLLIIIVFISLLVVERNWNLNRSYVFIK